MIKIDILTKKEVEDMINIRERIIRTDLYKEIEKLRGMIIDLNDIIKVLKRE